MSEVFCTVLWNTYMKKLVVSTQLNLQWTSCSWRPECFRTYLQPEAENSIVEHQSVAESSNDQDCTTEKLRGLLIS